jgi:NADPH2:quinone reductase
MKAAWYEKNGTAKEVLKFGELDKPSPSPGEVLVRIVTSGVNPSDVKSRRAKPLSGPRVIPHSDGAGIVEAVGAGVDSNRVGERVWLWNAQWMREHGSASEFIALSGDQAVRMPDSLDFGGAACLGIPALTALQAVRLCGPMKDRDVLITGAGSAVGHYASQIALARGARVIGTVGSKERAAHARAVGVESLIDYKTENVSSKLIELTRGKGVDLVIDMDLSTTLNLIETPAIAHHATVVCYGSNEPQVQLNFRAQLFKSIQYKFMLVYDLMLNDRLECLKELTQMLQAQSLRHAVGERFALADIVQAHERVESGQVVGNVVIDVSFP